MKKFFMALLITLIGTSAAYANGAIHGLGGVVPPHGTLSITLKLDNFNYHLTCRITDPNNANNKIVARIYPSTYTSFGGITLNKHRVSRRQFALTQKENQLTIDPIWTTAVVDAEINFINADNTDSYTVSDCTAVPNA